MKRSTLLRLLSATAIAGALALPAVVGAAYAAPGDATAAPQATPSAPATPPPPAAAEAPGAAPAGDHMSRDDQAGDHHGWRGHRGHGDMAARVFKRLDANGDGKISADEFAAAGQRLFSAADGNKDGILTPRELRRGARMARQQFSGHGMMALDANHDGTISKDEFLAFPDRIFARLDKNHDGKLDASEMADARQARMAHMRSMMGRQGQGDDHDGGSWRDDKGHHGRWGHHWGHHGDRRGGHDQGAMHRRGAGNQMMASWLRRADTDHDGALSKAEAEAANTALFKRFDANHDGSIEPDELAKAAASTHRHHRHGGPRHCDKR
jgi:Ca2+-binding EF-hand superfamily protein